VRFLFPGVTLRDGREANDAIESVDQYRSSLGRLSFQKMSRVTGHRYDSFTQKFAHGRIGGYNNNIGPICG
jgi:hypothetical protein